MTKHEPIGVDIGQNQTQKFGDFSRQCDKIFPELVGFIVLHLILIAIGVRAWFLL